MQSGEVIADRFELERLAGSGAMGEVWRARDRERGSAVAIKVLPRDEEGTDGRFLREAVSLSQLDHPGIVRYIAHGEAGNNAFYLAMEWLEGEDLSQALLRGPLTVEGTILLIRRVAAALGSAHAQGIVHRDIKPSNLFLPQGSVDEVKVVDFGVARIKDWTGTWTRNGWMLGTPAYMAPERARGDREIDARADLFSLGCVAFECLTGRCPFVGAQVMAVLRSILNDDPPSVRELASHVPSELDALISRMMAKDRAERPRDAEEVASALSGFELKPELPTEKWRRLSLTRHEQRYGTVLLIGGPDASATAPLAMLGSTEVSPAELDPTKKMGALLQRTGAKIERFGGELFALALPPGGTPSDRAAQLARSAILLRDVLRHRAMVLASGPREIGLRTEVGPRGEPPFVRKAARLLEGREQAASGKSTILLDDLTAEWLSARFDLHPRDGVFELGGERDIFAAPAVPGATPFVGRVREIAGIKAIFAESKGEPVARALLVTGPVGMGKSRLCREVLSQLVLAPDDKDAATPAKLWKTAGDPMTAGSPFSLAARLVAPAGDLAGILEQAARAYTTDAERAFVDFFAAECKTGPVLLVLEDLQWGDQPSLALIDAALRTLREAPLLVLAFARPEVHELFPNLWSERGLEEIRLASLTRSVSERLLRHRLGDAVPADAIAKMVDLADGNPLYLEELARAEAEGRAAAPEMLLAIAQSRLDKLDPEARRVLRAGSVFGDSFWHGGVVALLGNVAAAHDNLAELVEQKLIVLRESSRFAGEAEYAFGNALVRDAAYAMLTVADRALGHSLAAEWLRQMGEPDETIISSHFALGEKRESA